MSFTGGGSNRKLGRREKNSKRGRKGESMDKGGVHDLFGRGGQTNSAGIRTENREIFWKEMSFYRGKGSAIYSG